MTEINIAFGVTEDWLEHTYVTMCSILSHAVKNDEYKFFILSNITEEKFNKNFEKIKEKLSKIYPFFIKYIKLKTSDFDGVVHDKRVGVSAYFRLKLSSVTDINKVIYLDSDVITMDNIGKLWNYDIENCLIAAVEDKYSALMTCQANLSESEKYINSGVMLMNLKKFREENLEEKIFKKLLEPDNNYSDQDVLNDICRKRILYLPLKYNVMLTVDDPNSFPNKKEEYNNALQNPIILHYFIKPWILPVQYSEYWREYSQKLI